MSGILALSAGGQANSLRDLFFGSVGLASQKSAEMLSPQSSELFKGIGHVLSELILSVIEKRTRADFVSARAAAFGDYFRTVCALSALARVVVPSPIAEKLTRESFCEWESDLRGEGLLRFGETARDQALFTVWTLRKINNLLPKVFEKEPEAAELRDQDKKFAQEFNFHAVWAQFHLDCLITSIRQDRSIHPEFLEEICDGLRAAVNAYAILRQGVELRTPKPLIEAVAQVDWDQEEQDLLDSSMAELQHDAL